MCFGAGRRKKKEKLEVRIPPGVDTGTHLRLSRKGDLFYQVAVEMPARLKKKEEEMLKQIAELKGEPVLK